MSEHRTPEDQVRCPYCKRAARCVQGIVIYPHRDDLASKWFYLCGPCDAWVGCHPGTKRPLGRLADAELRSAKIDVHVMFDALWKRRLEIKQKTDPRYSKGMARGGRYKKLAELMGIPREECHIGMFDVARCRQALEIIESGALGELS